MSLISWDVPPPTFLADGGKQRPRVRTAAEDFLGRRWETESVLQLRIFLGDGGNQRPRVRATAENAVG